VINPKKNLLTPLCGFQRKLMSCSSRVILQRR